MRLDVEKTVRRPQFAFAKMNTNEHQAGKILRNGAPGVRMLK
jgi:hypothetical protein